MIPGLVGVECDGSNAHLTWYMVTYKDHLVMREDAEGRRSLRYYGILGTAMMGFSSNVLGAFFHQRIGTNINTPQIGSAT